MRLRATIDSDNYYYVGGVNAAGTALKILKNTNGTSFGDYPGYDAVDAKDYLWKIESTQVGATYVIDLESPNGSVKLHKFAKMPYANGINLYDDFACTTEFKINDKVLIGIYEATAIAVDGKTLNAQLGNGFQFTIDTEKDKKATIEGADILSGTLTAVDGHRSHIATDGVTRFQLMTADSSFIVVNTKANWGISGLSDGGLKLAKISKEELAKNAANYWNWFEIAKSAGATDAVSLAGIVAYKEKTTVYGDGEPA